MKKNIFYDPKTTLISDALRDVLPVEEEREDQEAFPWTAGSITVALVVDPEEDSLLGQLIGVEINSPTIVKVDVKTEIRQAYNFTTKICLLNRNVDCMIIGLEKFASKISGPFRVTNVKIVEIDEDKKTCVFGIDLFKESE